MSAAHAATESDGEAVTTGRLMISSTARALVAESGIVDPPLLWTVRTESPGDYGEGDPWIHGTHAAASNTTGSGGAAGRGACPSEAPRRRRRTGGRAHGGRGYPAASVTVGERMVKPRWGGNGRGSFLESVRFAVAVDVM